MVTLNIENIPEELYEKLKASATAHRRSINGELIYCLETVLMPRKSTAVDRIHRARALRPDIQTGAVSASEILDAIDQGRP